METVAATQDDSSGANPSSVKSEDSSPQHDPGRGSPPPNCAICLGTCRNKSFTDSCLHQFCFKCLLTWSKVKAECPLCKQNFRSIIHNVRSNLQYEEYLVEQRTTEETAERIDIDNLTTTRRFRYRTTLTLPRRETLAIQQLLLHYPLVDVLAPPPRPRRRSPASFRRTVYRHNLWARPLPDFTGRYRDCSPQFYRYNDSQMHRLVPWLNRELHYLLNENVGHISYVLTRILELLPQYHVNSAEFRDAMHRYFGERTDHFLHELYCFASTPYDMTGYDRNVQYTTDSRISTMVNEILSSSESDSVDSDIVMVSSSGPAEPPPGPSRPAPADTVIPIETISHSDTDDDSSEVMVVGYIKPPQDRTPEVVDLLGSDSDVIVQEGQEENVQEGPEEVGEEPRAPLVKLSLKRMPESSDSDEDYHPRARRRRRRARATTDATPATTTTSSCSTTDSPSLSPQPPPVNLIPSPPQPAPADLNPFAAPAPATPSTDSHSDSTASYDRSRPPKKRYRKKAHKEKKSASKERERRKSKKRSHRERRDSNESDKRRQRKSHSGKGVKSSRREDEPGPSARRKLRSVVNVMYPGHAPSGPSLTPPAPSQTPPISTPPSTSHASNAPPGHTPPFHRPPHPDSDTTDSEDNLPLNLSLHKSS